jgi:hypothetical protein
VTYRGWVLNPLVGYTARWLPPDPETALTWGEPTTSVRRFIPGSITGRGSAKPPKPDRSGRYAAGPADTLFVEVPLQAFALGKLTVPGLSIEIDDGRGPRVYRLPVVTLDVIPVLSAADSNADYRQLHAPLAAPWWERIPWRWVFIGLFTIAAAVAAYMLWRRRRPQAPAAAPAPLPIDPRAEALAALAALRALNLPEHGRFAEHAFRLGQILRRYLEVVTQVARPGDTTPELVMHLKAAGLPPDDQTRLAGLLRAWDRVKFAREPYTLDEAVRSERAVETFLRRPAGPVERVA